MQKCISTFLFAVPGKVWIGKNFSFSSIVVLVLFN